MTAGGDRCEPPALLTVQPSGRTLGRRKMVHVTADGKRTMCSRFYPLGTVRTAPHPLPDGASWCGVCLGSLAMQAGRTGEVAALLGLEGPQ